MQYLCILAAITLPSVIVQESKAAVSSGCIAEVYTGEICQSVLAASQSCIPGRNDSTEVFIQSIASIPQELVEQQLIGLFQFVTPSPECGGELLSFLCVEAFSGFCDPTGTVYRTSRPDCERITTTVCAVEFLQLLPLIEARGADLSCNTFPASSTICNCEYNTWDGHGTCVVYRHLLA